MKKQEFELMLVTDYTKSSDQLSKRIHAEIDQNSEKVKKITLYYKNGKHLASFENAKSWWIYDDNFEIVKRSKRVR